MKATPSEPAVARASAKAIAASLERVWKHCRSAVQATQPPSSARVAPAVARSRELIRLSEERA